MKAVILVVEEEEKSIAGPCVLQSLCFPGQLKEQCPQASVEPVRELKDKEHFCSFGISHWVLVCPMSPELVVAWWGEGHGRGGGEWC